MGWATMANLSSDGRNSRRDVLLGNPVYLRGLTVDDGRDVKKIRGWQDTDQRKMTQVVGMKKRERAQRTVGELMVAV